MSVVPFNPRHPLSLSSQAQTAQLPLMATSAWVCGWAP